GLLGVELPGMQEDTNGAVLLPIQIADTPARIPIWQKPKVRTAAKRRTMAGKFQRGHREFDQCSCWRVDPVRITVPAWTSIIRMSYGKDAGIVHKIKLR